jgi:DNA repair protein RadC
LELGLFILGGKNMTYSRSKITQQLELLEGQTEVKKKPAKRVDIVSLRMVKEKSILYKERSVRSPEDGYRLLRQFIGDMDREVLMLVCLDTKNQPTAINICHIGSLNSSIVHPREIMKTAILSNAASIIIAHNHPSGNAAPSNEDIEVTKRMKEAGKIIGIDLLDHIIVGDDTFVSLKEKGYI